MVLGGALAASTFLPGLWIEIMSEIERNRSSGAVRIARLGVELVSLLGIWIFHYGLVTLVGCYGLWNLSKWGLVYSRVLSIANSIFAGLGLLVVIILGIPGITASLVTTVICIFIVLYLYTIIPSWNRWGIYFRQIQERTTA
jgi:uncharacterized membrane protein (DUF2068 family)